MNRYWRNFRGRMVKSAEGRAYCHLIGSLSHDQGEPLVLPLSVSIRWYRGRKSGDLDNRAKVVLDALQGVAYVNDSQIVELHMYRADDKNDPRVEVVVEAA
jgi:Holliday junction resolvase RusA-like endonuclease